MTPGHRAAEAMRRSFGAGQFDPCMAATIERVLAQAIEEAVAEEREACAKAVEGFKTGGSTQDTVNYWGDALVQVIRARR